MCRIEGGGKCLWESWLLWGVIIGVHLGLFLMFCRKPLFVDESGHSSVILRFAEGDFGYQPIMTTLPGYHALVGLLLRVTGLHSLPAIRFIDLIGALIGVVFFYRIVSIVWPQERQLRTAQFAFFPVLFPYFFLVYTDIWCLVFILIATELTLKGRVFFSALALAVAVMIRQPAIFWAGFLWLLTLKNGSLSLCTVRDLWRETRRTWVFLMLFVLFGLFVLWNGGVAMESRSDQSVTFNTTNVWFFLFVFCLLFPLQTLDGAKACLKTGSRIRMWSLTGVTALCLLFALNYKLESIYSRVGVIVKIDQGIHYEMFVLHNNALILVANTPWIRLLAVGAIPLGLAGLLQIQKRFWWLIPIALLSVVVLPYIDPRYYIVPLSLFLAFRKPEARPAEWIMTGYYLVFAIAIDLGAFQMWYSP